MIATRQIAVTDAAWVKLKATIECRKVIVKEHPEVAGWPSSGFRFGGGVFVPGADPSEPTGTNYAGIAIGGSKIFETPPTPEAYLPGDFVAYIRLVSGSTTFDVTEE